MKSAPLALTLALLGPLAAGQESLPSHPRIEVETSAGDFTLELSTYQAPETVAHFVELVDDGFYDGLVFHRVIEGFMIQGGGYTSDFEEREDDVRLQNESRNSLSNRRGSIAMARTSDPHSASSQFYINVADNQRLDPQASQGRWGYTVFGFVIEGMDTVDAIATVEKEARAGFPDAPAENVVIKSMRRVAGD